MKGILAVLMFSIANIGLTALIASIGWGMFVSPVFGLAALNMSQTIGFALLISIIRSK